MGHISPTMTQHTVNGDQQCHCQWISLLPRDAMVSAVYAVVVCPSICVCVCVSVTLQYCIKMAKHRITQIMPHDSTVTLVF